MVIWPTCNAVSCTPKYEDFVLKCGNFQNIFKHLQKNTILGISKKQHLQNWRSWSCTLPGAAMGMAMGCHLLAVEHQQMTWSNARQSQGPAMWHSWMLRGDGGPLWNHMRFLSQKWRNTGIPKKHSLCQAEKRSNQWPWFTDFLDSKCPMPMVRRTHRRHLWWKDPPVTGGAWPCR